MNGGDADIVAVLGLLGLPAQRYLETADPDERLLLRAAAIRGAKLLDRVQRNQAVHVVNVLGKALR